MKRTTRRIVVLATGTATMAAVATFAVSPSAQALAGPTQHVIIMLAPSNSMVYNELLTTPSMPSAQRRALFATVIPTASQRADVLDTLVSSGFHVDHVGQWEVTASAPQATVQSAMSTTYTTRGWVLPANARQTSPLWQQFGRNVSAMTVDNNRMHLHHAAVARLAPISHAVVGPRVSVSSCGSSGGISCPTGADLNALYGAPTPPLDNGWYSGPHDTIATLQFSGWSPTDLSTFATDQQTGLGLPNDPVKLGQYVGINTTPSDPTVITNSSGGGDFEVALDQENLLRTAPYANQRAYFAPNGNDATTAEVVALDAVSNDAAKYNIVALSLSWGSCEADMTSNDYTVLHQSIGHLVAQGVTMFSSSGDSASFDCAYDTPAASANQPNVDYPASDPFVVGVGGTSVANDGGQTYWYDTFNQAYNKPTGGGGGLSTQWSLPAYQSAHGISNPGMAREVPDISADADPATGPVIYSSSTSTNSANNSFWGQAGGTSLAAPLMAASYTNMIESLGRTTGLGDIHSMLYSAGANAFHDITNGFNGTYSGAAGYDMVTGLGAPVWSNLISLADLAPKVTATDSLYYRNTRKISLSITAASYSQPVAWGVGESMTMSAVPTSASDPTCSAATSPNPPTSITLSAVEGTHYVWVEEKSSTGHCNVALLSGDGSVVYDVTPPTLKWTSVRPSSWTTGIDLAYSSLDSGKNLTTNGVHWTITHTGGATPDYNATQPMGPVIVSIKLAAGVTYTITGYALDLAGNRSAPQTKTITVPWDDKAFTLKGWTRSNSSAAYAGSYANSSSRSASATKAIAARSYTVYMVTCPTCGKAGVYLNGKLIKTLDTYSAKTVYRVAYNVYSGASQLRTLLIKPYGTKSSKSKGTAVRFDGVLATP